MHINNWYYTGDKHQNFESIKKWYKPEMIDNTAIIYGGDGSLNVYFDKKENSIKQYLNNMHIYHYFVRGNHDMRPQDIDSMVITYDDNVGNLVYKEHKYPYIRYLMDGEVYIINGYKTLIIGGAYSVDKEYRLTTKLPWFKNEQLSNEERTIIENNVKNKHFDIIITHTCPIQWQPTTLFISSIDQSKVDDSMERWLGYIEYITTYNLWLCGHYHDDRILAKKCEMFYNKIEKIDNIYNRWNENK